MAISAYLWSGGSFLPCEGIPASDRGFRYGMALFESLAVRGGRVEFLQEHLSRLETACHRCGWPCDREALSHAGKWLGKAGDSVFARIYLTAGEGGPAAAVEAPRLLLLTEPRPPATLRFLNVVEQNGPHLPLLSGLKTANYWANVAALSQARSGGADEALLFNPAGELVSAAMANVFVQVEGAWITPPPKSGARAGVVREWVLRRLPAEERALTRADLPRVEAAFLTSSWNGVEPVASLNLRPLATTVGETLRETFFATV